MTAAIPVALIGVVMTFLMGVLGYVPIPGLAQASPNEDLSQLSNEDAVHGTMVRFGSAYSAVIDDMLAHQKNPDYARAEKARQEMTTYAALLSGKFRELETVMRGKLAELEAQPASETTSPAN